MRILVDMEKSKFSKDGFIDLSDTIITLDLDAYFTFKRNWTLILCQTAISISESFLNRINKVTEV